MRRAEPIATPAVRSLVCSPWLLGSRASWQLPMSLALGDEYASYRQSKVLLEGLYRELAGTRFSRTFDKIALDDPWWEQTLQEIARVVRRITPSDARILVVDKYDPTLLHLSERRGWHFPDRRLLAGGYPRNGEVAIAHLEELRRRGATHIVFPSAAFWWLDFYKELREHLERTGASIWHDHTCIVYALRPPSETVQHEIVGAKSTERGALERDLQWSTPEDEGTGVLEPVNSTTGRVPC
jgi:hypothetical protein